MSNSTVQDYFACLGNSLQMTEVTGSSGQGKTLEEGVDWAVNKIRPMEDRSNKVLFIGNGGSAGISSHMAIDFLKNGQIPAIAFNDGASLTCLSNDLGFDQVFAKQIEMHAKKGDLLISISSSGKSQNILKGVQAAKDAGCTVLTMSGFQPENPLRSMGDCNFYVPSSEYGFVEISHLALCHTILDIKMGWKRD